MTTETEKKEIPLKCTNKSSCYVFVYVDSGNNVTRKLDLVPLQQFFEKITLQARIDLAVKLWRGVVVENSDHHILYGT